MFQDSPPPPSHTHTHTQNSLHFNSSFSLLALLSLSIHIPIALHANQCQIHINQKQCHLPLIFQRHLPSTNIVVQSKPNLYELATTKEWDLHFILSGKDNYDFNVQVQSYEFVPFVKAMIDDRECLGC